MWDGGEGRGEQATRVGEGLRRGGREGGRASLPRPREGTRTRVCRPRRKIEPTAFVVELRQIVFMRVNRRSSRGNCGVAFGAFERPRVSGLTDRRRMLDVAGESRWTSSRGDFYVK